MKCEDIREALLDLAGAPPSAEQKQHLDSCAPCAAKLADLRQTMALLEEWKAPEASPYFDARLRARLRAEQEAAPRGLLGWLRSPAFLRPAAAAAFTLILAAGVALYNYSGKATPGPAGGGTTTVATQAAEGSAVADLQALDKNEELLADFDLLDELTAEQETVQQ